MSMTPNELLHSRGYRTDTAHPNTYKLVQKVIRLGPAMSGSEVELSELATLLAAAYLSDYTFDGDKPMVGWEEVG